MKFYNFIKRLCAFILGSVFLIGGMFKLMDPVGSALVMESYFSFLHLGFLNFASTGLALFFNLLECFIGVALISGIWLPLVRMISLVLLIFFTFLTLLLLIFNPEMDCGCFGEVVHLTHLQSFLKNIVLLGLWAVAFLPFLRQHPRPLYRKIVSWTVYALILAFTVFSFIRLPLLDLTDLHTGTELSEGMIPLRDESGEYMDNLLLRGRVAVISVYKYAKADSTTIAQIKSNARKAGIRTVVAVSGDLPFEGINYYKSDRKTLMSLNRANMGVSFISGGQVAQKWTPKEFLSLETDELKEIAGTDPSELVVDEALQGRRIFEVLALVFFVLLLI
ncbi:MAG: MauE/DoxX family redox-associated membrane protein [Candidatus Cryptobacteroides sp.]